VAMCSRRSGEGLTTDAVTRLIKRIGARAGFAFPVHAHMLRHGCGYALANKGHDTRAIQDWVTDQSSTPSATLSCRRRVLRTFGANRVARQSHRRAAPPTIRPAAHCRTPASAARLRELSRIMRSDRRAGDRTVTMWGCYASGHGDVSYLDPKGARGDGPRSRDFAEPGGPRRHSPRIDTHPRARGDHRACRPAQRAPDAAPSRAYYRA
jgi:hypothetical protein